MRARLAVVLAITQAACVSDVPVSDGGMDSAMMPGDASGDGGVATMCLMLKPALFPAADAGPFCPMAGPIMNHCAKGDHCCNNVPAATRTCGPNCAAGSGVIDVACYNSGECPMGQSCCGDGIAKTGLCSYPVVVGLTRTFCQASCTGYQACASSADCNGKTCTAAFPHDPKTNTTYPVHLGVCL
jgi:hypothetical protein